MPVNIQEVYNNGLDQSVAILSGVDHQVLVMGLWANTDTYQWWVHVHNDVNEIIEINKKFSRFQYDYHVIKATKFLFYLFPLVFIIEYGWAHWRLHQKCQWNIFVPLICWIFFGDKIASDCIPVICVLLHSYMVARKRHMSYGGMQMVLYGTEGNFWAIFTTHHIDIVYSTVYCFIKKYKCLRHCFKSKTLIAKLNIQHTIFILHTFIAEWNLFLMTKSRICAMWLIYQRRWHQ